MAKAKLGKLKKKAWSLLSQAIRLEASGPDGQCRCITCGCVRQWNDQMHAGHFIDGRVNAILFDERGIAPQCMGCNVMLNGRKEEYWVWMEDNRGRDVIDDLRRKRKQAYQFTRAELESKIDEYRKRVDIQKERLGML